MTTLKYQAWPELLSQFQKEMSKVMGRETDSSNIATSQWMPAVDIKEEADHFVIIADIPGVNPKDIHITMENGLLTIRGEREANQEENTENYSRIERSRGVFYRRFSLPDTADSENISAKGKHGVLEIVIPKVQKAQLKKIDIQVEE